MIDVTPQILKKFEPDEIRLIEQQGWKNSDDKAYPCLYKRDKYNYDAVIYKLNDGFMLDVIDEQTEKKSQNHYGTLKSLLKKLKKGV